MPSPRTPARMAQTGRAVARQQRIAGELRPSSSHSHLDVLVVVPQAVARRGHDGDGWRAGVCPRAGGPPLAAGDRGGAAHR